MTPFEVDPEMCRKRQARLLELMRARNLQGVAVTQNPHVQWLAGLYFPPLLCSAAFLKADGHLTVITPRPPVSASAADTLESYPATFHSTMRNDQQQACLEKLSQTTGNISGPIGVEFSSYGLHGKNLFCENVEDVEADLFELRRQKGDDELAMIQQAIDATEKMYTKARQILRPGISEIEIFNALQTVAVEHLGEPLTGTGNDYQCCSRGGPPRNQVTAHAGELYILDLGPAFRGYYADNCRTLAVTQPDDHQQLAWEYLMKAFEHVESSVKPGKSCKELFDEVQAILDVCPVGRFNHHLGHGIGMFPHEGPHLNPNWEDEFEVGDVFTAEPGLYDSDQLRAGMRIENDYVVTESGVRNLTPFAMEL